MLKFLRARERSAFETWAWTEVPAYRLGLLLGYSFAVYFGISALIAGVPAFDLAAPEGWTPVWASLLILSGPIGIFGILKDNIRHNKIELVAAVLSASTLVVYAGTILFIAYGTGDLSRSAVGAGIAWLASPAVIRMLWLISRVSTYHTTRKN